MTPPPDGPGVVGSPAWLAAQGQLRGRTQLRYGIRTLAQVPRFTVDRVKAEVWRRRPSVGTISVDLDAAPDSTFAWQAVERCNDHLSPAMVNHSWRAWAFGRALAEIDGATDRLDAELFFVAAMLHDIGLGRPDQTPCFTRVGSDAVFEVGDGHRAADDLLIAASAVTHHVTPGLTEAESGVHGVYLQQATMVDLIGVRTAELPLDFVQAVCRRWPVLGVNTEASRRWVAESRTNPRGRAALVRRWGQFSLAVRFGPVAALCRHEAASAE